MSVNSVNCIGGIAIDDNKIIQPMEFLSIDGTVLHHYSV